MDESDGQRVKLHYEDSVLLASSLTEPINLEGQLVAIGGHEELLKTSCISVI